MISLQNWADVYNDYVEAIASQLITGNQFTDKLRLLCQEDSSPFSAIQFEVNREGENDLRLTFGFLGKGDPQATINFSYKNGINCLAKSWRNVSLADDGTTQLRRIFDAYWKDPYRSQPSYLINMQTLEVKQLCDNYLQSKTDYRYTCFIFGDLDRFNLVNDFTSTNEGDRAILEFGMLLTKHLIMESVLVHRSGDEFISIVRCNEIEHVINLLYSVSQKFMVHDFKLYAKKNGEDKRTNEEIVEGQPISFNVSFGVSYLKNNIDDIPTWEDCFECAENTMAKKTGGPHGTTRISSYYEERSCHKIPVDIGYYFKSIYCLTKSNIDTDYPFANIWLNTLSEIIAKSSCIETINTTIESFLKWVNPNFNETNDEIYIFSIDKGMKILNPVFIFLDVAMAIAHGLTRNINNITAKVFFKINSDGYYLKAFIADKEYLLYSFNDTTTNSDINILFISSETSQKIQSLIDSPTSKWAKKIILIKVGHEEINLPAQLFYDVIIIDDRPTKGGALPDLWEPILAQIVTITKYNKNIDQIIIQGDTMNGQELINLLNSLNEWDDDLIQWISEKTKVEIRYLHDFKTRLANHVVIENNFHSIINLLYNTYITNCEFTPVSDIEIVPNNRILSRKSIIDDNHYLKDFDGIRVPSINEAYPIMLDIARVLINNDSFVHLTDQAGRKFIELTDFKVHLFQPLNNMIPYFFQKRDIPKMDLYFEKAFMPGGLFFEALTKEGQYEHVLSHIIESTNTEFRFVTRRAILVVPHLISEPLSPLGLVSVRIMPRFDGRYIKLSFSYTWRTVEAVIGFPYSIYGSVKFSKNIIDDLNKKIKNESKMHYTLDTVSYIAHSLHMFTDTYSQEIIRGIINDASH